MPVKNKGPASQHVQSQVLAPGWRHPRRAAAAAAATPPTRHFRLREGSQQRQAAQPRGSPHIQDVHDRPRPLLRQQLLHAAVVRVAQVVVSLQARGRGAGCSKAGWGAHVCHLPALSRRSAPVAPPHPTATLAATLATLATLRTHLGVQLLDLRVVHN